MAHALLPVAVHIFFQKDDKILLMKRQNTGFKDGSWSIPAGRLDEHESIRSGAIREAHEEVGVTVQLSDLSEPLLMHHHDERGERLYAFFLCQKWSGEFTNNEPDKCAGLGWHAPQAFPPEIVPHIKTAYENLMAGKQYAEYGFAS
ncbi:MAG: NUDIX domain-containing protein [Patescibacteria group bacterium]